MILHHGFTRIAGIGCGERHVMRGRENCGWRRRRPAAPASRAGSALASAMPRIAIMPSTRPCASSAAAPASPATGTGRASSIAPPASRALISVSSRAVLLLRVGDADQRQFAGFRRLRRERKRLELARARRRAAAPAPRPRPRRRARHRRARRRRSPGSLRPAGASVTMWPCALTISAGAVFDRLRQRRVTARCARGRARTRSPSRTITGATMPSSGLVVHAW